ncbi:sensor domain-containing protein [Mycobacterium sp. CBMA293]|uniref:sensor domain-containing protein n=1 Tax=unclassified Mycolicibacterium TaxID=2636767 RepID=UPI0012DC81BB|nr:MULTISPECIES: sensor domain-containing protein [unclassified Mycolicibacterium]MUL48968.1 sensor domain-containing protein [Mycolicibacterium sp. CBMA 360]MUL58618.1 sensor domain-containing protein [Mycolicibacterium sp. CBMA 335]MUL74076.1 sensor domain-containing protein [Mycolicibacterium sp. CBMA 311]MUL93501.1 sensor domain-containing protein [Mycolicibacterium sp. CBMA 230]MUM04719.1 sensor domain-containing protein [Mycolicibacterium sp. CBMA 213]
MRRSVATLTVAVAGILVAGCGSTPGKAVPVTTPPMVARPLVERELDSLLLNTEQVNAIMGSTAMAVLGAAAAMSDNSGSLTPPECLVIDGPAEATVYANSGSWAEREQSMNDGDKFTHYLKQSVVLFPTQDKAQDFFNASAQAWPACTHYVHTQSQSRWSVAPITNANDTLSTLSTEQDAAAPGWICGRALARRNNIIIDVNTCSPNPADSAVKIANQIGTNVAARW